MEDDHYKRRPRGYTLCPFCEEWVKPGREGECESCLEDESLAVSMPNVLGLAGPKGVGKSTYAEKLSE